MVQEAYTLCHDRHRSYYMGERSSYHDRVLHAVTNEDKIFSLVIDIMESCELKCPYGAHLHKFPEHIDSVLVGAKVRGIGLTLYRTTNTMTKFCDLIIHVLLSQVTDEVD